MSAFIDQNRGRFGVEPICQTLGVSASAYYQRATGDRSAREIEDERLLAVIRQTHRDNFEAYGYRKMWKTLLRSGETAPRCQVQRLMSADGLQGAKRLVLDALRMALGVRAPGADFQLVAHTDAGSQYTSEDYTQTLDDARVLALIGTVGDALDNAMAESFVDSFKTELIADRVWRTRSQLELSVVEYLAWFNSARLHSALGYRPPAEIEADWHAQAPMSAADPVYDPCGVVSDLRC